MLVDIIKIIVNITNGIFSLNPANFQFLYNQLVVINLPVSNTPPNINACNFAPAYIVMNPNIENQPETPANANAPINVIIAKIKTIS